MSWFAEWKAQQPIPPDPKHDGIPVGFEQPSKLAITLYGHKVEMHDDDNGEFCTINGQRSKYGFFETVQIIADRANYDSKSVTDSPGSSNHA